MKKSYGFILFLLLIFLLYLILRKKKIEEPKSIIISKKPNIYMTVNNLSSNKSSDELIEVVQNISEQLTQITSQIQANNVNNQYKRFNLSQGQTQISLEGIGTILDIERNGLTMDEIEEYHIDSNILFINIPADEGEFITIEYHNNF